MKLSNNRGMILLLSAPSGTGKTSLAHALIAADSSFSFSVSLTTRLPRLGECDGREYHFVSHEQFDRHIQNGDFLEHTQIFSERYGTLYSNIEETISSGQSLCMDVDWQGFKNIRRLLPRDTVGIFLLPPSLESLRERLLHRGDSESNIEYRLSLACQDMQHRFIYDFVVVNDDFQCALKKILNIVAVESMRPWRCQHDE